MGLSTVLGAKTSGMPVTIWEPLQCSLNVCFPKRQEQEEGESLSWDPEGNPQKDRPPLWIVCWHGAGWRDKLKGVLKRYRDMEKYTGLYKCQEHLISAVEHKTW